MRKYELVAECTPQGRIRYFGYTGYKYVPKMDIELHELLMKRAEEEEVEKWKPKVETVCGTSDSAEDEFERLLNEFIAKENEEIAKSEAREADASESNGVDLGYDTEEEVQEEIERLEKEAQQLKEERFSSANERLEKMIGLGRVKKEIEQMRVMTQFDLNRRRLKLCVRADDRYHMIFTGNPGTGKTTVAKLIGDFYYGMGILTRGHVVVTERSKLIGEYIGQTEMKTREAIAEARGGVLFIDEAYTLIRSVYKETNDFGREVMNTLLTVLSEPEPDLIVILAGYEDKMQNLFQCNPGLKDRFPIHLHFEDYSAEELMRIACALLEERNFELSPAAETALRDLIVSSVEHKDKEFGNGRWVHNLIEHHVIRNMAQRVMSSPFDPDDRCLFMMIEKTDIEDAAREMSPGKNVVRMPQRIGFTA